MRCPKCKAVNPSGAKECDGCGVVFADIRSGAVIVNLDCSWNDYGAICGRRGSLSDATNGQGPWYCSEHYWKIKGWNIKWHTGRTISYRERWYEENKLPYESAKAGNLNRFREPGAAMEKSA